MPGREAAASAAAHPGRSQELNTNGGSQGNREGSSSTRPTWVPADRGDLRKRSRYRLPHLPPWRDQRTQDEAVHAPLDRFTSATFRVRRRGEVGFDARTGGLFGCRDLGYSSFGALGVG